MKTNYLSDRAQGGQPSPSSKELTMQRTITLLCTITMIVVANACGKAKPKADAATMESAAIAEQMQEHKRTLPEGAVAFEYAGHLYFDVVMRDSIPARMIFDTGNTDLLFDTQFFKEYFAPSPTLVRTMVQGTGNSLEAAYRDTAEWEYGVGEHRQKEQGATVLDLRKILGSHVDGMFGMEFMRGRKVEFSYADEYMRIIASGEQPSEGYVRIKCKWLDDRHSRMIIPISVQINDRISFTGDFLVDMGSSGSLSLNSSLAAKLGLGSALTDLRKKIYDTGGVGGSRTDYIFKADKVSVAGNDILGMSMDFSGNTQGMMAEDRFDGLVGNGLLERFDLIIDFAEGEIWLRPNREFGTAKKYDSGVTLTPQADGWVVNGLIEGGNAYKAGLRRGDVIVSINGLKPDRVGLRELKRMNTSAEEWATEVRRGDETSQIKFEKERY